METTRTWFGTRGVPGRTTAPETSAFVPRSATTLDMPVWSATTTLALRGVRPDVTVSRRLPTEPPTTAGSAPTVPGTGTTGAARTSGTRCPVAHWVALPDDDGRPQLHMIWDVPATPGA